MKIFKESNGESFLPLAHYIQSIFSSPTALNGSFIPYSLENCRYRRVLHSLVPNPSNIKRKPLSQIDKAVLKQPGCRIGQTISSEPIDMTDIFNSKDELGMRFGDSVSIDSSGIEIFYTAVLALGHDKINHSLSNAQQVCIRTVRQLISHGISYKHMRSGSFRCLALILHNPMFGSESANLDALLADVCDCLALLPATIQNEYKT